MFLRIGFIGLLVACYLVGVKLIGNAANNWLIALLIGAIFLLMVAGMYLRLLPAVLALPVLAIAISAIAGMDWQTIFNTVVQDGSFRLGKWIIAAIFGAVLAQVVVKTGIAQTAVKKTAELGGDKPALLAVALTIVIALLFTTLGGLGAVIMVATIVIPILLSLGLRPLYVGCLFLLGMSLGGAFNLVNWELYQSALGMSQQKIIDFALPFAGLMLITTMLFLVIEGKRMGKARYRAQVIAETEEHDFVPWYALLTPVVPLLPVLFFALLFRMQNKPAEIMVTTTGLPSSAVILLEHATVSPDKNAVTTDWMPICRIVPGEKMLRPPGKEEDRWRLTVRDDNAPEISGEAPLVIKKWTRNDVHLALCPVSVAATKVKTGKIPPDSIFTHGAKSALEVTATPVPTNYDFPITVALLIGIIYGAITTWRPGKSMVQLLTKAAFEGVAAVGPALVLMIGIGMVLVATMSPQVSNIIGPYIAAVVPAKHTGMATMLHYVLIFAVLSPLALYRGPLNLYGMGAGLMGILAPIMPAGAIMCAFMSAGMIQGVSDPTNTHNVWIANYTNVDVQDILKRTLPYMWILAVVGLIMSAVIYYR